MSRVDEALRRAAEGDSGTPVKDAATTENPNAQLEGVAEFSREVFPVELPDRRRSASILRHGSAPAEPVRPTAPRPDAQPITGGDQALFERIDGALAEKVVVDENMEAPSREQYRQLAATLHHLQSAKGLKVVMIASAVASEGKTLTAANLGLTFSESYKRSVLLIDADLRRPGLHKVFGTDNRMGLTDGLHAKVERKLPVRQLSERLALLQGGAPSPDPMAGLTSERMRRLLTEAREVFDWIIVDTPPVTVLPDANLLSAMVDGALLVVRAGSTSYTLVKRAVEAIGRDRILGVVLNRADALAPHHYGYDSPPQPAAGPAEVPSDR